MAPRDELPKLGYEKTAEDAAWVSIETPLSADELRHFIEDVERLYRINPLLEFGAFAPAGKDRFRVVLRNLSNGRDGEFVLAVSREHSAIKVSYSEGLKQLTTFRVEPAHPGARLVIRDDYGGATEAERNARIDEVDRSLSAWGRALHDYLRRWARWRWLAPWRWYMARLWLPMKPSGRRIVYMLWIITLFEFLALAAVV
ncbi:MAG: hypothetical protein F9K44_15550, partial [Hyphomicrobiaceae bacterium]